MAYCRLREVSHNILENYASEECAPFFGQMQRPQGSVLWYTAYPVDCQSSITFHLVGRSPFYRLRPTKKQGEEEFEIDMTF